MIENRCPSCGHEAISVFWTNAGVPGNSCVLLASAQEARDYPRGDLSLAFCELCGFISNTTFDPRLTEYSARYEETQGFSGTFREFHGRLARRLIEKYDLREKNLLEIGCGKGEFLALLCELGRNRGTGFDPSFREDRDLGAGAQRVTFVKEFFTGEHSAAEFDFICCKMTLEHIQDVADFVRMVRRSIGARRDTIVFFQVPDVTRILRDCAFEDIYYEHCSYFGPGSLRRLFAASGFEVLDVDSEYDRQYLTIEARPDGPADPRSELQEDSDLEVFRSLVATFPERCRELLAEWDRRLRAWAAEQAKVVLWGSGSKGVAFLTTLSVGSEIEYVVDINPFRAEHFMPGGGQLIVAPEFLRDYRPDVVIVMNSIYCREISEALSELGVAAEVRSIH